jgi:hypothetical protein
MASSMTPKTDARRCSYRRNRDNPNSSFRSPDIAECQRELIALVSPPGLSKSPEGYPVDSRQRLSDRKKVV